MTGSDVSLRRYRLRWSGLVGLIEAVVALGLSAVVLWSNNSGWQILIPTSAAAAWLIGFALWWLLLTFRPRVTVVAGLLAGGLTGLLAHPLAWYLAILWYYATGATNSLNEPTLDPIQGAGAALFFSLLSLVVLGWLTVPLGGLVGGLAAYFQSKRPASPPSSP